MEVSRHTISEKTSIREALTRLNEHSVDVLILFIVDDNNKLLGSLTDGDIRRGLIEGHDMDDLVSSIMFKDFKFATEENLSEVVKELNIEHIKLLPIVNGEGVLTDLVNLLTYKSTIPVEAFIMAGGEGRRLRPLTENTPKPLLKVGDKPIIEHNVDRLINVGVQRVHISINYLGEQLKEYFGDGSKKEVSISYVEENEPLGTVGSVALVEEYKEDYILLMNSDLLTNIDLKEMFEEFRLSESDLMVATVPYKVNVPYAVLETDGEQVVSLKEKPEYTYQSNAGIYLFKKESVGLIPKGQHWNATDLMEKLIADGNKVSYFPILGYWLDIGKHEDFNRAQEDIKHLKI